MSYGGASEAKPLAPVPGHVPTELIVDFDYFSPPGVETDPHGAWKAMQNGPAIVWTPRNSGHWIVTRADEIYAAMQDFGTFSSNPFNIPKRPEGSPLTIPLEIDPPELQRYRAIALPLLSPKALKTLEPKIRASMARIITELKPRGHCEFIQHFAVRMPVELFLEFVHLPASDRPLVRRWIEDVARNPDPAAQHAGHVGTYEYLTKVLEERRRNPIEDDLFTKLVDATRDGKIRDDEAISMALNILFGGIETVTSALSFIAHFLAGHPEHRRELAEKPELVRDAVEEFMRRFGILSLGRTVTRDTEFAGVPMRKDDRVLLPIHLYGLDESKFERPMAVDFHREHFRHINFGAGPHRCIGSNLARPELRIFLEEWMKEIPDFRIAEGEQPTGSGGSALSITYLPLTW